MKSLLALVLVAFSFGAMAAPVKHHKHHKHHAHHVKHAVKHVAKK